MPKYKKLRSEVNCISTFVLVITFLYYIIKELKRKKIKKEGRVMQRCKGEGVGLPDWTWVHHGQ